jgi:hypothetical protein
MTLSASTTTPPTPAKERVPYGVALLWGNAGLLGGAGAALLAALPLRPVDPQGWDELGWFIATAAACIAFGAIAATVGLWQGLRRAGAERAGVTALVYVPTAVLLAAVTAGVGALAAPAAALWLVSGLSGRRQAPGYGPGGVVRAPGAALPQRLVLTVVGCALLTWVILHRAGHDLGGQVHGEVLTWLVTLPVLVGLPVLLLRRHVSWQLLAAVVAGGALVSALAVPDAVSGSRPTPERLARDVAALPLPDGGVVTSTAVARTSWGSGFGDGGTPLPVMTVVLEPSGAERGREVPAALRPNSSGLLPGGLDRQPWGANAPLPAQRLPATEDGERLALAWEQMLLAEGWTVDQFSLRPGQDANDTYWLPEPARAVVDARLHRRLTDGPWRRAAVLPYGDGALLVVSLRP